MNDSIIFLSKSTEIQKKLNLLKNQKALQEANHNARIIFGALFLPISNPNNSCPDFK